jgi:hypothetical protein
LPFSSTISQFFDLLSIQFFICHSKDKNKFWFKDLEISQRKNSNQMASERPELLAMFQRMGDDRAKLNAKSLAEVNGLQTKLGS